MNQRRKAGALKTVTQFMTDALTGRLGVLLMVTAYSSLAVVLLAYVSAQVYTSSLMEDIFSRKKTERDLVEKIGVRTSTYTSLASRARISRICTEKLGMVEGNAQLVERVSIDPREMEFTPRLEFTERPIDLPSVLGSDIDGITEVKRK